jgi:hypothetical protein
MKQWRVPRVRKWAPFEVADLASRIRLTWRMTRTREGQWYWIGIVCARRNGQIESTLQASMYACIFLAINNATFNGSSLLSINAGRF